MKTLNEVVKAMEYCENHKCGEECGEECPYRDEEFCYEEDALHYLKQYRRVRLQSDNCCIDDYDKPMWNPKEHWE